MPALEKDDVIKISNYESIKLDEYDGKYSLLSVQNGQNDTFYPKWCFPSQYKNGQNVPGPKVFPVKVLIGNDKRQAIETLKELLEELSRG